MNLFLFVLLRGHSDFDAQQDAGKLLAFLLLIAGMVIIGMIAVKLFGGKDK